MHWNFLRQDTEERRNLILNGKITPTILLLSMPALMMGLVQSVIPVVDGLFINNYAGTNAASAISYSGAVINMMAALAQGLSVAAMAIIGQANGRGEFEEARKVSTQIFVFSFLLGFAFAPLLVATVGCVISAATAAVLIAVVVPLSSSLTVLFTRNAEVLEIANNALHIYTYSVIGFGVGMVQQGAFIGLGRTRVTLVASVLRIWLLRYIFILATERYLGFYSVFWGNLFSNYGAAIITTIIIAHTKWVSALPGKNEEIPLKA